MKSLILKFVFMTAGILFVGFVFFDGPTPVLSDKKATYIQLKVFETALNAIKEDTHAFPNTDVGLGVIYNNLNNDKSWQGPYARRKLSELDKWGQALIYKFPHDCPNNNGSFALYSVGKNGIDECLEGDDIYIEQD